MTVTFKNLPMGKGASTAAAAETEAADTPCTSAKTPPDLTANAPYGQNDLFRDIAVVWILVNFIDDNPRRVRRAPKRQELGVLQAVKKFGFRIPILVRTKPGGERYEVIDGHARVAAARMLEAEQIPCIRVNDLPNAEVRRLTLSLNRLQERGEWDPEVVKLEINELIEITGKYEIPGFETPEIEAIRFGADDGEDPADDLSGIDPDQPIVSKTGDLWVLGDHVVLCGSARAGEEIAALVGGEGVDAVFTDPPYNVKISGNAR